MELIATHVMITLATTLVVVMEKKYALLDGPMLTVCLVLPTIMVITVGLIVSHTMIPLAITHAAVMERKCAFKGGLVPTTIMVG